MNIFSLVTLGNVIDLLVIIVIAFSIYKTSKQLFIGTIIASVLALLCFVSGAPITSYIFSKYGIMLLIVVLSPTFRKMLEWNSSTFSAITTLLFENQTEKKKLSKTISRVAEASFELAKEETGALIIITKESLTTIKDVCYENGTELFAKVSVPLLKALFFEGAALHDGAVIIKDNQIALAGTFLPLSEHGERLPDNGGTRHTAALGITEATNSISIVVSEETGLVSVAKGGYFTEIDSKEELISYLRKNLLK